MKQITKVVDREEFLTHLWSKLKRELEKDLPQIGYEDKMIVLAWRIISDTMRHIHYALNIRKNNEKRRI